MEIPGICGLLFKMMCNCLVVHYHELVCSSCLLVKAQL